MARLNQRSVHLAGVLLPAMVVGIVCGMLSGVVGAQSPKIVLHEFIDPDVEQDMQLSATTEDGALPAAMQTRSGLVQAPDTTRRPSASEQAYGSAFSGIADRVYSPDRDTRRALVGTYDDPFSPSVAPYERLRAYDIVRPDFTLGVSSQPPDGLRPIEPSGSVRQGEDAFWGELTIDVAPDGLVRIPSVGPSVRLVALTSQPLETLYLQADTADNWYVRSQVRSRLRLILQLAVDQRVFGGAFEDGPVRGAVGGVTPTVPSNVMGSVTQVVHALGLQNESSRRAVVMRLVTYFRGFAPSADVPRGRDNIYLDLALSRKGVCRHRAYAFVVTALGMGIPSRMVVNRAHAWVEVHDAVVWRRIDLGGASIRLEPERPSVNAVRHQAPSDPFPWPASSEREHSSDSAQSPGEQDSGAQALLRSQQSAQGSVASANQTALANQANEHVQIVQQVTPTGSVQSAASSLPVVTYHDPPEATGPAEQQNEQPTPFPASISIDRADTRVLRGEPMHIEGTAKSDRGPCAFARIDVVLSDPRTRRRFELGAVSTNETGEFSGSVVIPLEVPVGDYDVVVRMPTTRLCEGGWSEL